MEIETGLSDGADDFPLPVEYRNLPELRWRDGNHDALTIAANTGRSGGNSS